MTKARLNEEELDMIEEALILYGAHNSRLGYKEVGPIVSEMIKKFQVIRELSPRKNIMMEPYK